MDSHITADTLEKAMVQTRRPHTARGFGLLALSFSTLGKFSRVSFFFHRSLIPFAGVIHSSVGTSPLYVLNSIWAPDGPAPPEEDVIGVISAIIWAMTLLPLVKYVGALRIQSVDRRPTTPF